MLVEQGYSRTVLVFNSFVIKLPGSKVNYPSYPGCSWRHIAKFLWHKLCYGLECNRDEHSLWKATTNKEQRELLCPVLFCLPGGFLIILSKAEPITDKEFGSVIDEDKYRHLATDIHMDNFGRLNDKIVLIDYAK